MYDFLILEEHRVNSFSPSNINILVHDPLLGRFPFRGASHVVSCAVVWADCIMVTNFEYAAEPHFTIAFWMTKERCSPGMYEYMYSHAQVPSASVLNRTNSNVNVYLGCEDASGGACGHGAFNRKSIWVRF